MTYDLHLGDRAYSSWSLRAWLVVERFGIAHRTHLAGLYQDASLAHQIGEPPARTVPTLVTPEGAVICDSLAIAEELANRHPDLGLWPADPKLRATARSLTGEMHSDFPALRRDCPMNLRRAWAGYVPDDAVCADLDRIETIWTHALDLSGGPWLAGTYSIADAFFAPVAARIAGYDLPVGELAQAYMARHLADPAFRRWRAMGLVSGPDFAVYARDFAQRAWPGPTPLPATEANGPSVNPACPYSGDPVTHFLSLYGTVWGFCNAFCRDKTLADPEAWPAFEAMRLNLDESRMG
ncbi:glutathione S-transferase [Palleronia aestuarii]|uniref:Glutathione S-transferase n=1 Tax=Palleronia aestuarii TaxID=568105 RepID=A0A2W7Q9K4_9RHOB|nr:glutathione S-transferase [Palleronia aestuarii]PZX18399.1 glutathione S-transferase [Palleronia aestuarii]